MFVALLSLTLTAQAAAPDAVLVPATPAAVLARVVSCGVAPDDARIREDDMLQESVVDIRPAVAPSDPQLSCLARVSAETYWFLTFDAATQARFAPLYSQVSEAASLASAQAWVAAHGLASRVPHYREGQDDPAAVVATIETLCRVPAGSFRGTTGWMKVDGTPSFSDEQLMCAINVSTVAGLKFGFIGNEAEARSPSR